MPTLRERFVNYLMRPELDQLQEVQQRLYDAYQIAHDALSAGAIVNMTNEKGRGNG